MSFAADVLKRERHLIIVLREVATSYTVARIKSDEIRDTLRDALLCFAMEFHPLEGPPAVIRVDLAPGFNALCDDDMLCKYGLLVEIGRTKNPNKNQVAEKPRT